MTDSMKILQIPIPAEAIDALGLKQCGRCSVTITDGKIIIEKRKKPANAFWEMILPNAATVLSAALIAVNALRTFALNSLKTTTKKGVMRLTKMLRVLGKRGRITIPFEIRQKVGFKYNDVLSFTQADNNTVVVKRETICDSNCPFYDEDPMDSEPISLTDFLDGLTDEEQKTALVHLSANWAAKQGGDHNV